MGLRGPVPSGGTQSWGVGEAPGGDSGTLGTLCTELSICSSVSFKFGQWTG